MGQENRVLDPEIHSLIKVAVLEERVRVLGTSKASNDDIHRLRDQFTHQIKEGIDDLRGILGDKINSLNSRVLSSHTEATKAGERVEELAIRISHIEKAVDSMSEAFRAHAEKSDQTTGEILELMKEVKQGSPKALWARFSLIAYRAIGVVVFLVIILTQGTQGAGAAWGALSRAWH